MEKRVSLELKNGLGNKLLDMIGFYILCKNLNIRPVVVFRNVGEYGWGKCIHDLRLFDFNKEILINEECEMKMHSPNPSSSLCPIKVYTYLSNILPAFSKSYRELSEEFSLTAKEIIKPSLAIREKMPSGLGKVYGIHLRKSDIVRSDIIKNTFDILFENTVDEFILITNKLLEDIEQIIINEPHPSFLVVSEESDWKTEITTIMKKMADHYQRELKLIELDYSGGENYGEYNSVLDMFCLSQCREILQGVKYSSFSILASLLGNGKIRNYSKYTETGNICLIHSWNSAIEINGETKYDVDAHLENTRDILNIY